MPKNRLSVRCIIACAVITLASASFGHALDSSDFTVGIGGSILDGNFEELLKSSGVRSARMDISWSQVEKTRGNYTTPKWVDETVSLLAQIGMEPILILDYGNPLYNSDKPKTDEERQAFARYAEWVVTHYKGKVRLWDLWNEWDTHTGRTTPGTADDYVALAKVVYPVVKAANPDAVVLSGGISDFDSKRAWFKRFLEVDGLKYVDAISIHPYNLFSKERTPEAAIRNVDEVSKEAKAANGGMAVPIYITEMGYSNYDGRFSVTTEEQGWYLARFILLAAARPEIKGVWWYNLKDNGTEPTNKEYHFGLFDRMNQPKPSGVAMMKVTELFAKMSTRPTLVHEGQIIGVHMSDGSPQSVKVVWVGDKVVSQESKEKLSIIPQLYGENSTEDPHFAAPRIVRQPN